MKPATLLLFFSLPAAYSQSAIPEDYWAVLRLLKAGQYDVAISKCRYLITRFPAFEGAYKKLAQASAQKKDPEGAIRYFNSLLLTNPKNAYAYYGLGLMRREMKDFRQSQIDLQKSLELAPHSVDTVSWLVDVYDELHELGEARNYLQKSLQENAQNAAAHYGLGYIFLLRGDRKRAIASLDRSLELNPAILHAYKLESELYFSAAELENCSRVGVRLLEAAKKAGDLWYQGEAFNVLGAAASKMGEYSKAIASYQNALKIQEDLGNLQGMGSSLNGLGTIFTRLGGYSKAIGCYLRARDLWQRKGDRRGEGTALHNIGGAYETQGKYRQALSYYRQALRIRQGVKQDAGNTLNSMGVAHAMLGDYQQAMRYYTQALAIRKETGDRLGEDITLNNLGDLYTRRGEYQKAIDYGQQALNIAEMIHHGEGVWRSHARIAKALEGQGDLSGALNGYEASIGTIEKIRSELRVGEQERTGFLETKIQVYERIVHLLWKLHKSNPAAAYSNWAFEYAERAKARAFLDTLAESRAHIRKEMSAEQMQGQNAILREISNIQSGLFRTGLAEKDRERLSMALKSAEDRLDDFVIQLRSANPRYAELRNPGPYDVPRAQKEAGAVGSVLVEFMLGEDKSFVWAVSAQGLRMAALPGRREIEDKVRSYRRLLSAPPQGIESFDAYHKQAYALFQCLLRPIHGELARAKRIIIVPDGILYYLPFETLEMGGRRCLVSEYAIAYAPSASALGSFHRVNVEHTMLDLLAVGAPLRFASLDPLPSSRTEIEAIASLYPVSQRRLYLGERATESVIKTQDLSRYRLIHFATHGVIDEDVPTRSGLVFSPAKGEDDGLLQINEILNLELNAELVVLSACQSGLGKLVRGEGMVGLTRAFIYAGTESLVVSLWSVNDRSTADFMKGFYQYMKAGKSKPEALRQAKLAMLRSHTPAYRFPYFWAPFVMIGSGNGSTRPLRFQPHL